MVRGGNDVALVNECVCQPVLIGPVAGPAMRHDHERVAAGFWRGIFVAESPDKDRRFAYGFGCTTRPGRIPDRNVERPAGWTLGQHNLLEADDVGGKSVRDRNRHCGQRCQNAPFHGILPVGSIPWFMTVFLGTATSYRIEVHAAPDFRLCV